MAEEYEGPENPDDLNDPPPFFPYEGAVPDREPASLGEPIECEIKGVFVAENSGQISRFVLLTDRHERNLPILIGPFEAQAISLPLDNQRPDRPMTHDLLKTVIDRLGATVDRIVIDDLWNTIYYAKVYLKMGKEELEIDARPSDAIALAVRFQVPVYVSEGILESAGE